MTQSGQDAEPSGIAQDAGQYSVRAVLRVLDILDFLHAQSRGSTLVDIAAAAGLPKSSAFRYLTTLESRGYVEREGETGNYQLSLSLFLGPSARLLTQCARPYLLELRDRFNETTNLGVLDGASIVYLDMLESDRSMRFSPVKGYRDPIHCTALGKAIAATLSDDAVRRLLVMNGMPRATPRTIDNPEAFLEELKLVRRRGWAFDDEENEPGGRCVAVSLDSPGLPVAMSLSAPAARMSDDAVESVAAALLSLASRFAKEPAILRAGEHAHGGNRAANA